MYVILIKLMTTMITDQVRSFIHSFIKVSWKKVAYWVALDTLYHSFWWMKSKKREKRLENRGEFVRLLPKEVMSK